MINSVPTACTLTCDFCMQEFNKHTRHVFKSPHQAFFFAEQDGWWVNHQNNLAYCPGCRTMAIQGYTFEDLRGALKRVLSSYRPKVGDGDSKEKILTLMTQTLHGRPFNKDAAWKLCVSHQLVWFDEYSGLWKIRV